MANRYWVGGTGTWNTVSTANWSASSGGASGASVPTASDSVFFDQIGTYSVSCSNALTCLDFTVSTGTVTFGSGTSPSLAVSGSLSWAGATVSWSAGTITFNATTTGKTVNTNGSAVNQSFAFAGVGGAWTLTAALNLVSSQLLITSGTFDSGNYSITCGSINSNNSNVRTINLGSSTVTFSTTIFFNTQTNLTFNAGTSQINCTGNPTLNVQTGVTFYNVSFTYTAITTSSILGANTFNNLSITGRTTVGLAQLSISANQTINGTLTVNAGTAAAYRILIASNTIGTTRTLTCASIAAMSDVDFRDITIAGAHGTLSGTRLGDCKGNSNITFPAAKTVYFRQTGSADWGATGSGSWSATSGSALDATQFPLAQDTAVFPAATYPASGSTTTINAAYNIGTLDMSLRTSNTMTLATGTTTLAIYGNWINGTGITLSGTGAITFAGRTTQQITSSAKTFTQPITVNSPSGSVTLQDALTTGTVTTTLTQGTLDLQSYTLSTNIFSCTNSNTRTIAFGTGQISIAGTGTVWSTSNNTGLTVTGTGTISLTSASAKTFNGGGFSFFGITINQGGAGALTITGSNTFSNITNTVQPASILFTAGTTSTFSSFSLSGTAGNLITIGSVTAASHTLSKASGTVSSDFLSISRSTATGGAGWYAGANSTDGGNNSGWVFTAPPAPSAGNGNFLMFF